MSAQLEAGAPALQMSNGHDGLSVGATAGYALGVVALVLGAGLMSGLTLGLLSLDVMDLEVLRAAGTKKQRAAASRLIGLVSKPHWLLCTLLLCNAGCMEALPLLLDRLLNPVGAILLSVTAILVFGEIIPQAVCSRYGVAVGAACAPLVRVLMWVFSPVTWPLGKLLDRILGHEEITMKRKELKAMVTLHGEGAGLGGALSTQEVAVIHGAMDLTSKTALSAMTPIGKVFMLSEDALLDEETVTKVLQSGHSRVPVYRGNNQQDIIGLVLVKELLQFWRAADTPRIGQLDVRYMPHIPADTPMFDVLRLFQTGNSHMALLMAPAGTNIEELKRTRGRLESRDPDALEQRRGGEAAADVLALDADSAPLDRSSGGDSRARGQNGEKRKKRVSWKSSFNLSKRSSSTGERSSSTGEESHQQHQEPHDQMQQQQQQHTGQVQEQAQHEGHAQQDYLALEIIQPPTAGSPFGSGSGSSGGSTSGSSSAGAVAFPEAEAAAATAATGVSCCGAPQRGGGGGGHHFKSHAGSGTAKGAAAGAGQGCLAPFTATQVPVGIITLEDVMEELLQTEIIDETDKFMDNEQTKTVDIAKMMDNLPPHLHSILRAEMLAAAENFIKSSAWMPPNSDISPTAGVRATAAMRVRASSGAAAPAAGAHAATQSNPTAVGMSRSITPAANPPSRLGPQLAPVRVWNHTSDPGHVVAPSSGGGSAGTAATGGKGGMAGVGSTGAKGGTGGTAGVGSTGGAGGTPKSAAALAFAQAMVSTAPNAATPAAAGNAAEAGTATAGSGVMERADSAPNLARTKIFKSVSLKSMAAVTGEGLDREPDAIGASPPAAALRRLGTASE